jgi:hypothetical protein
MLLIRDGHFSSEIAPEKFEVCRVVFILETLIARNLKVFLIKYQSEVIKEIRVRFYVVYFNIQQGCTSARFLQPEGSSIDIIS